MWLLGTSGTIIVVVSIIPIILWMKKIMYHEILKIIMYSSIKDEHSVSIENGILRLIHENQFHCHHIIDSFFNELIKQPSYCVIVLMLIRDHKELRKIINEKKKLLDYQLILIYPPPSGFSKNNDHSEVMIQEGFKLYPRYASYLKDDVTDVFLVLKKMKVRIENRILKPK